MSIRRAVCLLFAIASAAPAGAAERKWLMLQAPSFGVISELDASATQRWAAEFDQYISAMETMFNAEGVELTPLTIVLFRQSKDFAPYRPQVESGQANAAGFFGRTGDWSVIGLSAGSRDTTTRPIIYHEAAHWFTSANEGTLPLWFWEGFAEALSTFRVVDGKGRWGEAIQINIDYLATVGLLPIEDILRASQDEALHGRTSNKYYPQAWAFVHYLMFGNASAQAPKLAELLRLQRETDLDTAFRTALGKTYEEFDTELRRYLRGGRYGHAVVELRDRSEDFVVETASEAQVELALGRLAVAGNNLGLASAHADRVIALVPASPSGYELQAHAARKAGGNATLTTALDRAAELGSRDPWIYTTKADRLVFADTSMGNGLDDSLSSNAAREAADLYARALEQRPTNSAAVLGFVIALLNLDVITDADHRTLNATSKMLPTNGLQLVGQAAVERKRGNVRDAVHLLGRAATEPYTLPQGFREPITRLRESWQGQWYSEQLSTLMQEGRFSEYRTFVDDQLAAATTSRRMRTYLENARDRLPEVERLHAASQASTRAESVELLNAIIDDPAVTEPTKRIARRMLGIRPGNGAEAAVTEN